MSVSSTASFEYLERLPGTSFARLYEQPSTALAIFRRMLPHLAKTFVMSLLYMSKPFLLSDLYLYVQPNSKKEADVALRTLKQFHIIKISKPNLKEPQVVHLEKNFASSFKLALTGGGHHNSFGIPSTDVAGAIDLAELDDYARAQWETILHYLVNSVAEAGKWSQGEGPTAQVKKLLVEGKLVSQSGRAGGITKSGFSFLLQEVNAQVWTLLILWIETAEKMQMDSVELLSFLFMLSSLELGRAYSSANLTDSQQQMLGTLRDFGLIYVPNASQFCPTRLATTLTSDGAALRSVSAGFDAAIAARASSAAKGFIIIETNYRLYAYTSSPLQIAVLDLFTTLKTRYPNMVAGRLTRQSIQKAVMQGITSDQIIAYLTTHAHPQLLKQPAAQHGGPVLPPTVVDQIRLWQLENERMVATSGYLFKEFENQQEYEEARTYADENGVLLWKSDAQRKFFVNRLEAIADFLKTRKRIKGHG